MSFQSALVSMNKMPGAFEEEWQNEGEMIADDEQMGFHYLGEQMSLRSALEWADNKRPSPAYLDVDEMSSTEGAAMFTIPHSMQTKANEIIMKEVADWLDTGSSFRRPDLEKHNLLQALAAMTSIPIGVVSRSVAQDKLDYNASLRDVVILFATLQLLACSFTLPPPPVVPGTLYMTPSQRQTPALISSLRYHSLVAPQPPASGHQARAQTAVPTWSSLSTGASREEQLADEVTRRRVDRVRRQSMNSKAPSPGDSSQEEILDHIIRQQKLEKWVMDGKRPKADRTEPSIVEADSSQALKRKRTEAVTSSPQPQAQASAGLRAIRSARLSAWTATPVVRSEPHLVYVQPVRELSLRRRLRDACRVGRRLRATLPSSSRMPFEMPEAAPASSTSEPLSERPPASDAYPARPAQEDGPADVGSPDPPAARMTRTSVSEMMLEASSIESQASTGTTTDAAARPGAFPGPSILLETSQACRNPVGIAAAPALDRYYSQARLSGALSPPPRTEPILPPPGTSTVLSHAPLRPPTITRQPKARRPHFWKRSSSKSRGVQVPQLVTSIPAPVGAAVAAGPVPSAVRPASSSTWLNYRPDPAVEEKSVTPSARRPSLGQLERARASHATYRRIFAEMELLLVRAESGNISDHDFGTEYARLGDELDLANANAPEGRPTF